MAALLNRVSSSHIEVGLELIQGLVTAGKLNHRAQILEKTAQVLAQEKTGRREICRDEAGAGLSLEQESRKLRAEAQAQLQNTVRQFSQFRESFQTSFQKPGAFSQTASESEKIKASQTSKSSSTLKVLMGFGGIALTAGFTIYVGRRWAATQVVNASAGLLAVLGSSQVGQSLLHWLGNSVVAGSKNSLATQFAGLGGTSSALAVLGTVGGGSLVLSAALSQLPAIFQPDPSVESKPEPIREEDPPSCDENNLRSSFLNFGFSEGPVLEGLLQELCALNSLEQTIRLQELQTVFNQGFHLAQRILPTNSFVSPALQEILKVWLQKKQDQNESVSLDEVTQFFKESLRQWEEVEVNLKLAESHASPALSSHLAAYFLAWQQRFNPNNRSISVLYPGIGADIATVLLATNAQSVQGIDIQPVRAERLTEYLKAQNWEYLDQDTVTLPLRLNPKNREFLRRNFGSSNPEDQLNFRRKMGFWTNETLETLSLERCILIELKKIGVKRESIRVRQIPEGTAVEFEWKHPRGGNSGKRTVVYAQDNLGRFLDFKSRQSENDFDFYYQKSLPLPSGSIDRKKLLKEIVNLSAPQAGIAVGMEAQDSPSLAQEIHAFLGSKGYEASSLPIHYLQLVRAGIRHEVPQSRGVDLTILDYGYRLQSWVRD